MKGCRVAQVTTVHAPADVRIFHKTARTLADHGYEVALVAPEGEMPPSAAIAYVPIRRFRSRSLRALFGPLLALRAAHRFRPSVYHFHDPEIIPAAVLLRLTGADIVYDAHEDVPKQIRQKSYIPPIVRRPLARIVDAIERAAARAFSAVVAATPEIARRFPSGRTVLVQNFPSATGDLTVSAKPLSEREPSVAYVGAITKLRGLTEVVRAVGEFDGKVRLLLAGRPQPQSYLAELAREPAWSNVEYHGYVDRPGVSAILGRARIGIVTLHDVPNYRDSQPIKLFEYMMAGLPVVASDFPIWRRIIEDADCGLLVDPRSPSEIAAAIRWLIDRPEEAEMMGRRGRERARKAFDWASEGQKLLDLYGRLTGADRPVRNRVAG
jgi:glycosyltransferase involved in cell wall biosynthesis